MQINKNTPLKKTNILKQKTTIYSASSLPLLWKGLGEQQQYLHSINKINSVLSVRKTPSIRSNHHPKFLTEGQTHHSICNTQFRAFRVFREKKIPSIPSNQKSVNLRQKDFKIKKTLFLTSPFFQFNSYI